MCSFGDENKGNGGSKMNKMFVCVEENVRKCSSWKTFCKRLYKVISFA